MTICPAAPRLPQARELQVPLRAQRRRAARAARAAGDRRTVNGARLWVGVGGFQVQPGELAKIALIVFLAGYLREKREVLAQGRLKDFGPLLLIWGAAMGVLVLTNDLGSALLLYGIFLAMLYVATSRAASSLLGLGLFVGGAAAVYTQIAHVRERVTIWLHPWTTTPSTARSTRRAPLAPAVRELPARELAVLDRRAAASSARASGAGRSSTCSGHHASSPTCRPTSSTRRSRSGARPRRRGGAPAPLHGLRAAGLQDRARSPTTASRSCSPRGSPLPSLSRRSSSSAGSCARSR